MTRGIPRRKRPSAAAASTPESQLVSDGVLSAKAARPDAATSTTPATTARTPARSTRRKGTTRRQAAPDAGPVSREAAITLAHERWERFFAERGWSPFDFQRDTWQAYLAGRSGLVHATTGTGKTYAAWGGPLLEWLIEHPASIDVAETLSPRAVLRQAPKLRVLWITPLRALAADTESSLQNALVSLGIPWRLERRTGDTSAAVRQRQRDSLPTALITTPESLSLLLTRPDAAEQFSDLRAIIVDEWHELLSTKRGVQTQLAMARLRKWRPDLRVWGLSATLGNLKEALQVLMGVPTPETPVEQTTGVLMQGDLSKEYRIECLMPVEADRFPWTGHLGIRLMEQVIGAVESARSSLIFTNTRSQTELWYQAILQQRPDWAGLIALHHGSLDQDVRKWVEQGLRTGQLKCVVCTSSLDLGVDFSPVDQVLQIGSPKGVARLLQRAGRSGHQPGVSSKIVCVPTNAWELVEFAAVRDALLAGHIESRHPRICPLDVLVQHAVTIAVGEGFRADDLLAEVRRTIAYESLTEEDWRWVLDFIVRGGDSLRAYPDYHRVAVEEGVYRVVKPQIARRHRLSIGTISSDSAVTVQYLRGSRLGHVEESFVSKLKPGDAFIFAGKLVELVRVYDMKAYVRLAKVSKAPVPRWAGGRMPLSTELSSALRDKLHEAHEGNFASAELQCVRSMFELQEAWSRVPQRHQWLVERLRSREGFHAFVFPFEGRLVHEGLASLFAFRLAQRSPLTFSIAVNDYGLELLSDREFDLPGAIEQGLLSLDNLEEDIAASLNAVEMAKRQFRDVARISGLIFQGFPGAAKPTKDLQATASLLFDVFAQYDPDNKLLRQARREVLDTQLETSRLAETLVRLARSELVLTTPPRCTPLAFPLLVDRLRERLTSEKLEDRVRRLTVPLEQAADETLGRSAQT